MNDIEFTLPDPNPTVAISTDRRIVPPPLPERKRKTVSYVPLRENPTDIRRQETTIQLNKLADWIASRLKSRVLSQDEAQDIQRAKNRRLLRDLRGFEQTKDRNSNESDISSPQDSTEHILQEGRRWFLDQNVGPFLDRVRDLARAPERTRLSESQSARLYVNNMRARTKEDFIATLKRTGLQILQEDPAKYEVRYSKKLRLEASALTITVRPNHETRKK
jgi:hypothetical protein